MRKNRLMFLQTCQQLIYLLSSQLSLRAVVSLIVVSSIIVFEHWNQLWKAPSTQVSQSPLSISRKWSIFLGKLYTLDPLISFLGSEDHKKHYSNNLANFPFTTEPRRWHGYVFLFCHLLGSVVKGKFRGHGYGWMYRKCLGHRLNRSIQRKDVRFSHRPHFLSFLSDSKHVHFLNTLGNPQLQTWTVRLLDSVECSPHWNNLFK